MRRDKLTIGTFLFYLQRTIKSYRLRNSISALQAKIIGKQIIYGKSKLISEKEDIYIHKLVNDGFCEFPNPISDVLINDIIQKAKKLMLYDPFNKSSGEFNFENIPTSTHVANFKRNDLVQISSILEIANDPGILRIVQAFLGATPTISNINMWWSIAGKSEAKDAQLFHRDVDDIKFCKLFIYLTDVGPSDGPHTYAKGSSNTNKLTKIRRYQDHEVETSFGKESITNFCRPKGSFFIVDTYGLHKGLLPIENNRLLLQVQYSLNPIGIESYKAIPSNSNYDKYINRLIIKAAR